MRKRKYIIVCVAAFAFLMFGCSDPVEDIGPPVQPSNKVKVAFKLVPIVQGVHVKATDSLLYENILGNIYSVNNFRILLSDIRINDYYSSNFQIGEHHLFDIQDPESMIFRVKDSIEEFDISSISLFIGFREEDNITGKYEELSNLQPSWNWEPIYGGGYYTFIMDGRYLSSSADNDPDPYRFDIGGKRLVVTQTDSSYKPNEIIASLPDGEIDIIESYPGFDLKSILIELRFDIDKLFQSRWAIGNYNIDAHPNMLKTDAPGSKILSENLTHVWSKGSVYFNSDLINPPEQ